MIDAKPDSGPWYQGITRYQWLVLLIASLGWVFDVFEGQIFVASMNEAMPSLVDKGELAAREGITDPDELDARYKGRIAVYNNYALGAFLFGGALGGIFFGILSDRIGRKRTMSLTILFYSLFTCVSAFSQEWWHLAGLRFLVAMGVGGEWAVASAMVAEVFPRKARAHVGGIFHASSVFGTYLAVAAGTFLIGNAAVHTWAREQSPGWLADFVDPASLPWRMGFALGVLPALLIIWIRMSLREPESWQAARTRAGLQPAERMGVFGDLFRGEMLRRTFVGVTLAAVGLATFWGAHIYGKNVLRQEIEKTYAAGIPEAVLDDTLASVRGQMLKDHAGDESWGERLDAFLDRLRTQLLRGDYTQVLNPERYASADSLERETVGKVRDEITARNKRWEMLGMFLVTTGGGIGLVCFGPVCHRIGRRPAFLLYHLGGLLSALVVFQLLQGVGVLLAALPIFGFLTLGMHAGYAIYFPELYPTRLRGTGAGFCFNAGRILAAPILFISGWMQSGIAFDSRDTWLGERFAFELRTQPMSLNDAASLLSLLFLLGVALMIFAPETKGRELPE
jgi:MFS family permease